MLMYMEVNILSLRYVFLLSPISMENVTNGSEPTMQWCRWAQEIRGGGVRD